MDLSLSPKLFSQVKSKICRAVGLISHFHHIQPNSPRSLGCFELALAILPSGFFADKPYKFSHLGDSSEPHLVQILTLVLSDPWKSLSCRRKMAPCESSASRSISPKRTPPPRRRPAKKDKERVCESEKKVIDDSPSFLSPPQWPSPRRPSCRLPATPTLTSFAPQPIYPPPSSI